MVRREFAARICVLVLEREGTEHEVTRTGPRWSGFYRGACDRYTVDTYRVY